MRARVIDSIADAIQGHASKTEAGRYRHPDITILKEAVDLIRLPC